jgi:hypothetical protein
MQLSQLVFGISNLEYVEEHFSKFLYACLNNNAIFKVGRRTQVKWQGWFEHHIIWKHSAVLPRVLGSNLSIYKFQIIKYYKFQE